MDDSEEALVRGATHGDAVAVQELLVRYLPGLRGYLRLRAGPLLLDRESCSDIAQSVCREILENLERFRYDGSVGFRRWLYTTARRKIADRYEYYRAKKRDIARDGDGGDDRHLHSYADFFTPSQQAEAREELDRVEGAFAQLSEEHQQVILLTKVLGLSRAEAAEEMGRSEGALRALLFRALATLSEMLD
ncbi:MAG: sigma-70 family RNA polymerase sigma factor [Planctomycetes bacterium]|nr:sigma-70 family RNA polymerase sigma factor [Planctomycetota bacterium]